MQPEDRDPAYLWDMLQAAREVEGMLEDIPALIVQLKVLLPPLEVDKGDK